MFSNFLNLSNNRTNNYILKGIYKHYLIVTIISTVTNGIGNNIDAVITGNYFGSQALAALGSCSPLFLILYGIGSIFGFGAVTLSGYYIGRNEKEKKDTVFTLSVIWATITGVVISLLVYFGADYVAEFLGATDDIKDLTVAYIQGISFGMLFNILNVVFINEERMDGSPNVGLYFFLVLSVFDIAFDFANVYIFKLGLFGMGLATAFSYALGCVVFIFHFRKPTNTLKFVKPVDAFSESVKMLKLGVSKIYKTLSDFICSVVFNNVLGIIGGSIAITAFAIQKNLALLFVSIPLSFGVVTNLMTGIFYGEEDEDLLARSLKFSLFYGVLVSLVIAVLAIVFNTELIQLFGSLDGQSMDLARVAVVWYLCGLPFLTITAIFQDFYLASQNLKTTYFLTICESLVFVLGTGLILSLFFGEDGIFSAYCIGEIITLVGLVLWVWIWTKKFPTSIKDLMMLPKAFEVEHVATLNRTIRNDLDEVLDLTQEVRDFSKENNIDEDKAFLLALSIEEMAGNVTKYAYKDDKDHFVDIFVLVNQLGEVVLRMRDDGVPFNPFTFLQEEEKNQEDPYAHMGIRLIKRSVDFIDYRYSLGMNNLLIRIT